MFRSRAVVISLCLYMGLLPATQDAQASPLARPRIGTGLNDADRQAMNGAAARLFQRHTIADGATDSWSNPKSGNGGSITVLHHLIRAAMPRREVRYDIRLHSGGRTRAYTLNWCKTANGAWKIS